MFIIVLTVLLISLLLYSIFGGADFGAGILELFKGKVRRKDQERLITEAMGPVWETNHMWLIVAVVILFNGFPSAYAFLSTVFHVPLTLLLVGIIFRGCAFTFRHYDAFQDKSQQAYSFFFSISSTVTPFLMGTLAGACLLGKFTLPEEGSYREVYIDPWLNAFCFSVGVFVCCLFAFLAAVFLILESEDQELREIFRKRALWSNVCSLFSGGLVFLTAYQEPDFDLLELFFFDPASVAAMVLATVLLVPLWKGLYSKKKAYVRPIACMQVLLVLFGYLYLLFPHILRGVGNEGNAMTLINTVAGPETMYYLAIALLVCLVLITAPLLYLFYIFKRRTLS